MQRILNCFRAGYRLKGFHLCSDFFMLYSFVEIILKYYQAFRDSSFVLSVDVNRSCKESDPLRIRPFDFSFARPSNKDHQMFSFPPTNLVNVSNELCKNENKIQKDSFLLFIKREVLGVPLGLFPVSSQPTMVDFKSRYTV